MKQLREGWYSNQYRLLNEQKDNDLINLMADEPIEPVNCAALIKKADRIANTNFVPRFENLKGNLGNLTVVSTKVKGGTVMYPIGLVVQGYAKYISLLEE